MAELIADEATAKLGGPVAIDVMRPLQAYDAGARARTVGTLVEAMARAKEAGIDPADVTKALSLVEWAK